MENISDSPGSGDEENWSEVDQAYPDGAHRGRRDGFTPHRRRIFLKTLRKTGCAQDACRRARISDTAAYNLRDRDAMFARLWDAAVVAAGADMELLAWTFAVEGEEEEVWAYGKRVGTRRRRDARLFRMLLQGSNPHKYGGNGVGTRKQIERKIRKEMEDERKAAEGVDIEEVRERLAQRIERLRIRMVREEGGHIDEQGRYVPPPGSALEDLFREGRAAADPGAADPGPSPEDPPAAPDEPAVFWRSVPRAPDS
jgi:hypothetical protein